MQKLTFTTLLFFLFTSLTAQNFSVNHGEEFKIARSKSMPVLLGIDESGIYMANYRQKRKGFTADYVNLYSLLKYDFNFKQLYDYEYDEGLEKSEVSEILLLKKKMFLFSYDFNKKEKRLLIYGTTLNKENGKMNEPLRELINSSTSAGEFLETISFTPNADSSQIIVTALFSERESQRILQLVYGFDLKRIQSASIYINQPAKFRNLFQIGQTSSGLTIANIKKFEEQEVGKKRKKNVFTDFSVEAFDGKGAKPYTISPVREKIFVVNQKVYLGEKDLFIIALYDTDKERKAIKGILLERYDAKNGTLLSSSMQSLPSELIANTEDKITGEKNDDTDDGITKNLRIRSFSINPVTQRAYVFAEIFSIESYPYTSRTAATGTIAGSSQTYSRLKFTNSDILLIETDAQFRINHINSLPKKQIQRFELAGHVSVDAAWEEAGTGLSGMSLDFYSSFGVLPYKDKMILLLNDHSANGGVTKQGANPKELIDLSNCSSYALIYDPATRAFTRKLLFINSNQPVPLMKNAYMVGNDIFLYAREPHLIRKSDFKIIKVSIK
ncbi:hypothetical protein [Lacibacter sp.]|uniref:hypothetical protein n=1 Tax=Lacibacter sp. TaxID=1915409 RepID=UPI002B4B8A56|nr:hypothetical protein [Lacibacter sp.]HLP39729.1 hypothetical protein [Lacibacter sp.]